MILQFPKPQRVVDKNYISWIKSLSCLICSPDCHGDTVHHHQNAPGQGAMGSKTDDTRCIPLCDKHHKEIHQIGAKSFDAKYNIDYEYTIKTLLSMYRRGL